MVYHISPTSSDHGNDAFDLSQIYIERKEQQERFEFRLNVWRELMAMAQSDNAVVTVAPSPDNKIQGLVVMLYGRGGFGKSTLLKHYRDIALQAGRNLTICTTVNWESAVEDNRGLFNPPPGQEINAHEYFKLLGTQLAGALKKKINDFRNYHRAVNAVEDAQKQAVRVLGDIQKEDRFGWLRGLFVEGVLTVVSAYVPGAKPVLSKPGVEGAINAGAKMTQDQLEQVWTQLHNRLGSKFNDLNPKLQLGLALGRDLHEFARNFPLLIFFDTYEEVDEGDPLLRIVMGAAGLRVGWVLAGRDNLWAGSEQRERSIALEYGYKDIVLSDRGLSVNFNAGDVGAFTLSEIMDYFALLCKQVPREPPLPAVTEEGAKRILDVTKGVPLAIKLAAGLYMETANLDAVTEKVEGKREIVDQMVSRYLLHTRDDETERWKLYGLALLRRADEPAVAAALGLVPEEARTKYASELSRLQRHYSFIFTEKEEPSLHQEVRYFLRLRLLEIRGQPGIVALNEQLKEAHEAALKKLEEQRRYDTLKARLEDDKWVGVYLDLIEQQFWLDPDMGVRYILPFMVAAAVYRRSVNKDAAGIGEFFEAGIGSPYHNWWKWADQSLIYTTSSYPLPRALQGLEELYKLAERRRLAFPEFLPSYQEELEAAIWWRLGEASRGRDDNKALKWYEKALTQLGQETELSGEAARTYVDVAKKLFEQQKYEGMISLLDKAIQLKDDYAEAYNDQGVAYYHLKEYELARKDYDRAIELDPNYAIAYNNRGVAYKNLKEYELAMENYNSAIMLAPNDASAYNNRGRVYYNRKEYEQAIKDYEQAIELDPKYVYAYNNRGNVYYALKEYEQAIKDYEQAIELDPKYVYAYNNRGNVYYALKEYEQAIKDYGQAIELDPKYVDAYNDRGLAYYALKEYERAFKDFDRAIELDPKYVNAYNNRGMVYYHLKEYKQAIKDYGQAIELDPKYVDAYNIRGLAYYALKEYERAIKDYERAIELDLKYVDAYNSRGDVYYALKEYARAIKDYQQALELDSGYAMAYAGRAQTYLQLKNTSQAKADYNRCYELDPTDMNAVWMAEWVGMSKSVVGIEMADRLEKIATIDQQHYLAYVCRGVALGLRGKLKTGLAEVEKAISLEPEQWDAYFWKGMLCAYYYQERRQEMIEAAIGKALQLGLPSVLLTPLYWLENYRREFFEGYVRPLLERYRV